MKDFSVTAVILATDESSSLIETVNYMFNECTETVDKALLVLSRNASPMCVDACNCLSEKYGNRVEITVQTEDGLGNAALHSLKYVKTSHMTFFPADMAIELKSLDKMIEIAKDNPDVIVKTSRWLEKGSFIEYSKVRMVLNRVAQTFLRILFLTDLTDLTNPVQLIPSDYEKKIKWKEKGFCTLIEHTIVPVRFRYKFVEVPVKCFPRTEGKSKNSWLQTMLYLKTAIRIRFTPKSKLYGKDI